MWRAATLLCAVSACNAAFGLDPTTPAPALDADQRLDLDEDGIPDTEDPCIAAMSDSLLDDDSDQLRNPDDPCPHFNPPAGMDSDQDGYPDICDPFPQRAGDRRRCIMELSNPDLNARLWKVRPGEPGWTLTTSRHLTLARGPLASLVATEPLAGGAFATTFEVEGTFFDQTGFPPDRTIGLWLRAGEVPDPSDVGCWIRGGDTSAEVAITDAGGVTRASSAIPLVATTGFVLWVTLDQNRLVTCRGYWSSADTTATRQVSLPAGNEGFVGLHTGGRINTLSIFERDN